MTKPAKRCPSCGHSYSLVAWYSLRSYSRWEFAPGRVLDMRECTACHSHIALQEVVIRDVEVADACAA